MTLDRDVIRQFCGKHGVRRLSVFGSAIHGRATPESDLDILVEFEKGHEPGLEFFQMEDELSEKLGVKVDLNTPAFLSRYFRDKVLAEAEVQFVSK
jgi:uncharacterized protein